MHNEFDENFSGEVDVVVDDASPEDKPVETQPPPSTDSLTEGASVDSPEKEDKQRDDDQPEKQNPVSQYVGSSQVDIVSGINGSHNTTYNTSFKFGAADESQQSLDVFVRIANLESPGRTYKSLNASDVVGYSGALRTERILLLSCYDEDVALSVAKSIAYEANVPSKELVTIDENGQGRYSFRNLIDALARPKEKRKASPNAPAAICVWDADRISEHEISGAILNSLLSGNSRIEQYKYWLTQYRLCLICIVPPERVQKYNDSHSGSLRSLNLDFLSPLLERYDESEYETLVCTIRQQRMEGRWSDDDAEFYKEVSKHVRNRDLSEAIQKRMNPDDGADTVNLEDLFNREDPLIDTVLYCATYFPDLSPQDFSYLVELFLSETTEEVTRRVTRRQEGKDNEVTEVVESVPLVNRWRRDADRIRRRCKLATVRNEDGRLVVDFQVDGLRQRLSQYIRNENYFFYESHFVFLRQQGLLLSPKKTIAEGARQLFVDVATQYAPNEVANWLYEIIYEFEEIAQTAEHLEELTPRFQLLPDLRVRIARRYIAYGLSRILLRLDKEDDVHEAVRLFWQKLVQTQHRWFLDVLRRMGDSTPPNTLKWLRQLLDQGSEEIRRQVRGYLVVYLLHKESTIYPTLKELMLWPKSSKAGRIAQEVLIAYCAQTNKQLPQQDYGQWPSPHPLFGFQSRPEAEECLDLLVSWVCAAASEIDPDNALLIVADIFAGWYFILSGSAGEPGGDVSTDADLSSQIVRDLLFQCLTGHSARAQRNTLAAIWDQLRTNILNKVIELDDFINEVAGASPSFELLSDAAIARRKLMDTRASLSELRKTFMAWTAKTTPA